MNISLQAIANLLGGELHNPSDSALEPHKLSISINTRTLQLGDVYLALIGKVYDGHDFVAEAVAAGAQAVIVSHPVVTSVPSIVVSDTHQALGQLASANRQQVTALVAGVTGSNGKTTTKEMLAAILGHHAPVLFTQGNLNNDIGVPLTLLRLQAEHHYAVIEMGANHIGEIAYTSRCANADVVIITNVGDAHLEGFGSTEGIAKAKGEIIETLQAKGTAIINRDDAFYPYWQDVAGERNCYSFGLHPEADFKAGAISIRANAQGFATQFTLITPRERLEIALPLAGQHNVLNALAASAAAYALGVASTHIQQGLAQLKPVKGRLQPVLGQQGALLIDDTYNANPSSLKAALEVLTHCGGERWLALGAFGELGPDSLSLHAELAPMLKQYGVTRLFAVGNDTQATVAAFGAGAEYFATQEALIDSLTHTVTPNVTLLIKGSRSQRMENVVTALANQTGQQPC